MSANSDRGKTHDGSRYVCDRARANDSMPSKRSNDQPKYGSGLQAVRRVGKKFCVVPFSVREGGNVALQVEDVWVFWSWNWTLVISSIEEVDEEREREREGDWDNGGGTRTGDGYFGIGTVKPAARMRLQAWDVEVAVKHSAAWAEVQSTTGC